MHPKILLVDDREDNLFSLETILAPDGYRLEKARSGREALKILLKEVDFALILMDVQMPVLDGFETASLIYQREKLKNIPVIFITAEHSDDQNVFKGYRTGGVDYIFKPVNLELLRAKVAVFVELYKKNRILQIQEQRLKSINKSLEIEIKDRIASEEKIKELNHQLLQNVNRLESANKELDRFASMISHDLQEPLRKIITFSERLSLSESERLSQEGQLYINRIQNSAERMRILIRDMLTLSRISADKDSFVNTDMNALVREVLADMEEKINEKDAQVVIDALPSSLHVNPGLIRPLFHNLLNNSLKYSKEDTKPVIRIYSHMAFRANGSDEESPNHRYCKIYVEDNGIGFNQEYAEQIFTMFKRLHVRKKFEGTGIGLAICKKIVEQHNGYIYAKSKENEGATFVISLPLHTDPVMAFG